MKTTSPRMLTRWSLALLMAVAVAVTGCKKDEKPAENAAATKEGAAEATKKGEAKKGGEKKGETKKGESKEARHVEAASSLAVPDDVIAYGGVKSLDDLTSRVTGVVDKVAPVPGLAMMITKGLEKELKLQNMDWLARDKSAKFVGLNPKVTKEAALLLFPMKSKEDLEKALPAEKEKDVEGNAYKYTAGSRPGYVNFSGDYAVFTRGADAFAKGKAFLDGDFAKYAPTDVVEITFEVDNLTRIFADELKMARGKVTEEMNRNSAHSPFPGSAKMMQDQVDMMFNFIDQLDVASLSARVDGDHVKMPFFLRAKSGTPVATFFTATKGRAVGMLDYVPAGSYLVFAANFDPKKFAEWSELSLNMLGEMFKLSADEKGKLSALMKRGMELQTGESVMALYKDENLAVGLIGAGGTTDGPKLRDVTYETYGILWSKLIDLAKAEIGGELPPEFDLSSFTKAIESVGKVAEPMGIGIKLGNETYKDAPIDTIEIIIDYDKFPLAKEDPEAAKVMSALVGKKIVLAAGYGKTAYAMAMGPNAVAKVKEILDGKKGTASIALKTALEHGVSGASMLMYLSAVDGLKAFSAIPDLAPMRDTINGMTVTSGAAFTFGAVGDGGLQAIIDVPLSHVQQVMKLAKR